MKKLIFPILFVILLVGFGVVIKNQNETRLETLKAFNEMAVNLNASNEKIERLNKTDLNELDEYSQFAPEIIKPYFKRAQIVRKVSDDFIKYIEKFKNAITAAKENKEFDENFLLNHNNQTEKVLTKNINSTRRKLLDLINTDSIVKLYNEDVEKVNRLAYLLTDYDKHKYSSWAQMYFENKPLENVSAQLTKLQNECLNFETEILHVIRRGFTWCGGIINPIYAQVVANSSAVMVGSEYKAEVILLQTLSKPEYEVFVNNKAIPKENGVGVYSARPTTAGLHTWEGVIKVQEINGTTEYPFLAEYQVFQGSTNISSKAMDVLYIGIDNPLEISAAGYSPEDTRATMTGGNLVKGDNKWIARVYKPGVATVSVSARRRDGSVQKISNKRFIIKKLPAPEPKFGSLVSGNYTESDLLEQENLTATITNFMYEGIKWKITSFTCSLFPLEGKPVLFNVSGSEIKPAIKDAIRRSVKGNKIVIDEIKAIGPDGNNIKLAPISLNIQ